MKISMIVHQSVCKQCGSVTEIDKNAKAFQVVLKSYSLKDHNFNDTFGSNWGSATKKSNSNEEETDWVNESYCDKECFVEFLKENMTTGGMIKLSEKELQEMRDAVPDEVKTFKEMAKQLTASKPK